NCPLPHTFTDFGANVTIDATLLKCHIRNSELFRILSEKYTMQERINTILLYSLKNRLLTKIRKKINRDNEE
ncbi:MAG: hypothetical protein AAB906_04655, partial [Patescibacteria group bacterium]